MGSRVGSSNDLVRKLLSHIELLIYLAACALIIPSTDMFTRYVLGGLLSASVLIVVVFDQPHLVHVLLSIPLLYIATNLSYFFYAMSTSLVAALVLQKGDKFGNKSLLNFHAWQLAAGAFFISLAALGISNPYLKMILDSDPVRMASSSPQGQMILAAGPALLLQFTCLKFFMNVASTSFTPSEITITTQLLCMTVMGALSRLGSGDSSSASEFIIQIVLAVAWIGFWLFQFISRLPANINVKIGIATTLGPLIAATIWPSLLQIPAKLTEFVGTEINFFMVAVWAATLFGLSIGLPMIVKHVSNTVARKYFHLMALAVFLPGMIMDPRFLRTALCLVLVSFLLIEVIRWTNIFGSKISEMLTKLMRMVTNERDNLGPLTLSHTYLLIGCGLPLLVSSSKSVSSMKTDMMAGPLLVLAVGDSLGSIIGSKFGKHKWPQTSKSIQGTLAAISSTLLSMFLLSHMMNTSPNWTVVSMSVALTFALEAFTKDIDNLILPIFYYSISSLLV